MLPNSEPSPINLLKARSLFDKPQIISSKGSEFDIGDHLSSPRGSGLYSHHGIYIGDSKVIHYSGFADGMSSGKIEITSLSSFSSGNDIFIHLHKNRRYSPKETVDRAESRLGEDWYNVIVNNCEHFAYWCIMGNHSSKQINDLIETFSQGLEFYIKNSTPTPTLTAPKNIPDVIVRSNPSVMTGQSSSSTLGSSLDVVKVVSDIFRFFSK